MAGIKQKGGTVNNAKTVTGSAYGIYLYDAIGKVTNSGSVTATAANGYGVWLQDGGSVTNKSGASITGSYGVGLRDGGSVANAINATISGGVIIGGAVGTVANSGLITGSKFVGVSLTDGGSVTNAATGTISSSDTDIYITGGVGHVMNLGTLSVGKVDLEKGGTITNSGTISWYVEISGGSGKVTNSGTIERRVSLSSGGTVTNSGTIEAGGVLLTSGGTVTNAAGDTIHGHYAGVALGYNGLSFSGGGVLSNAANATITGGSGVYAGGSAASVTNSGSIKGMENETHIVSGVTEIFGDGVSLNDGGTVTNKAGGSIAGVRYGIYVNDGMGTITNSGTITGATTAIEFAGSGANTLTLETGSVLNGAVVGSTATGATNALVLEGHGKADNAFTDFDTLSVEAAGTWTLGGASTIAATTASTGTLAVTGALTTAITEDAATTVAIAGGHALTLDGDSTLSGTTKGAGTLAITAGATTIDSGALIELSHWSIHGSTASVTLDGQFDYSGAFTAGSGAVIDMAAPSDFFDLDSSGSAVFSGATLEGSETLYDGSKTTTVSGLTVEGDAGFANESSLKQTGSVILGGDGGVGNLGASSTWDISDNAGISPASGNPPAFGFFNNGGLFEKTGGTGVSVIATSFTNGGQVVGGEVLVSSGTLDFKAAVNGTGSDTISGAATLEFGSTVSDTQTIDFTGAGGTLDLGSPTGFAGVISGFDMVGSGDSLELLGDWKITGYTQTTSAEGALTLKDGSKLSSLVLDGSYTKTDFNPVFSAGHTTITYS